MKPFLAGAEKFAKRLSTRFSSIHRQLLRHERTHAPQLNTHAKGPARTGYCPARTARAYNAHACLENIVKKFKAHRNAKDFAKAFI